jgi:hypothetical protein
LKAGRYESCCHIEGLCDGIKLRFGFGRRDVADGLDQAAVIEPADSFEGGVFDRFKAPPWPTPVDVFGLVVAVDRLGEGVVAAVDRRLDPDFRQAFGVFDRDILGGHDRCDGRCRRPVPVDDHAMPVRAHRERSWHGPSG